MSVTSDAASHLAVSAQERIDLAAAERPVVVEIGDHRLHERLGERDGARLVAEMVVEDRERELLRAFALVGPLEAVAGEALDLVVLIEPLSVDRDDQAVDGALALVGAHDS